MNEARRVRVTGAAKADRKSSSRVGRLLALLSVLTAAGRERRHGIVAPLPSRPRFHANRRYPVSEGHDMGRLLR